MTTYVNYIEQYVGCLEFELKNSQNMKPIRLKIMREQIERGKKFIKCQSKRHLPPSILACPPNPKYLNTDQNFKFMFGMLADLYDDYDIKGFLIYFDPYYLRAMGDIVGLIEKDKDLSQLSNDELRDLKKDKYEDYWALTATTVPKELQVKVFSVVTSYSYAQLENMLFGGEWSVDDSVQEGFSLFMSAFFVLLGAINKYLEEMAPEPVRPKLEKSNTIDRFSFCMFQPTQNQMQRAAKNKDAIIAVSERIQARIEADREEAAQLEEVLMEAQRRGVGSLS